MKTTKLFFVLASVLIFIVLLPTNTFPQQYQLSRDHSVSKTSGIKSVSLKTDSSASVWYVSPYSFGTITEAKKTSSTDAYHGNFSGRFQASGVMKHDNTDGIYYAQVNFVKVLDKYYEQPDTFVYHIKSGLYQYLYSVTIGFDGDNYWALLNPRSVVTDNQWHSEVVWNPVIPNDTRDPFNYLVFAFGFTDNWGSVELPFSADVLIDYVYGKFKDGRIVVYEDFEDTTTDVSRETSIPVEFKLEQNYPNPFNPVTVIKFKVPSSQVVTLKVYDLLGREVATMVNEEKQPGSYEVKFDGSNLASGMYIYQLQAGNFVQVKKMMLIK